MEKKWYDNFSFDGHTDRPPVCYICDEEIKHKEDLGELPLSEGHDDVYYVPVHKVCLEEDQEIIQDFEDTCHSLANSCGINPDEVI